MENLQQTIKVVPINLTKKRKIGKVLTGPSKRACGHLVAGKFPTNLKQYVKGCHPKTAKHSY